MEDFDTVMEEYYKKEEEKRQKFLQKCHDKVDNETIYKGLSYIIADRYNIKQVYQEAPFHEVVYIILNYYIEHVDEDINKWLHSNNAPLVKTPTEINKIFKEFSTITENDARETIQLANHIYGLDLKYHYCDYNGVYIYSLDFDFNSFKPIDLTEIKELKTKINILKEYDVDTNELEKQLNSYGFTDEQLELI